jgi:hypothetical protein
MSGRRRLCAKEKQNAGGRGMETHMHGLFPQKIEMMKPVLRGDLM